MIDIHSHILPGMDDGAADMNEALEMAEIAVASGIREIIATPHCNMPGRYDNYYDDHYKEMFAQTCVAVKRAKIPINLYPGMEVFATEDIVKYLKNGKIITLAQSKYLLLEFSFQEDPLWAEGILDQLKEMGIKPVIAHAERYEFVQDNLWIVYQWRRKGYVIQANKGSFLGRFGRRAQETVYQLLDHNLISIVASDAHGAEFRTPYLLETYDKMKGKCAGEYRNVLFYQNPNRICDNRGILMPQPIPFGKGV